MDKDKLSSILRRAADAYYNGLPIMSDVEYDALTDKLRQIDPTNELLKTVGYKSSSVWPKVKHETVMGSLLKETDPGPFLAWAKKYAGDVLWWSEKLDGFSLCLTYDNGKLVRAATRGDGEIGDDITPNVLKMKDLPLEVDFSGRMYVKCEAIIFLDDWNANFVGDSNPRNSAAGTSRRLDGSKCEWVRVMAHGVDFDSPDDEALFPSEYGRMVMLKAIGFLTPNCGLGSVDSVLETAGRYENGIRSSLPYEIDGLVIKSDDVAASKKQGYVDGCPRAARAWKFKSLGAVTTIKSVTWQTGRTGVLSPVAELEPVKIGGVTISRCLLDNYPMMQKLNLFPDKLVYVERRQDVIPKLALVPGEEEGTSTLFPMPEFCESCGSPTSFDSVKLFCTNKVDCPAQLLLCIMKYLRSLSVKGIGEKIVTKLLDDGLIETPADLYRIGVSQIAVYEGHGEKNAKKQLDELRAKSHGVTLDKFVESLAIPGFGTKAKDLMAVFPTIEEMRTARYEEVLAIPGFGEHLAGCVVNGFSLRGALIDELLTNNFVTLTVAKAKVSSALDGKSFCFTGFRDPSMEDAVVSLGGKIASGVSKNTTHLVVADKSSSSSKAKKAKELGLAIIDQNELSSIITEALSVL